MFEAYTRDFILGRMLENIPDEFDKREGSIIYDALAPAAFEIANMYIAFDAMLTETFGDTASRDYLIRLGAERGLIPTEATKALVRGIFTPSDVEIPLGSRFNCDFATYTVAEKVENGVYNLECDEAGTVGNEYTGQIIPIDYITGLETATITQILIYGEDAEETERFRARYLNSFNERAFSGNKADYIAKAELIGGVGSLKIEPVWDGAGTVRLTILDSESGIASQELINKVQNAFDPNGDGKGDGLAPIGHVVTVRTAEAVTIDVTMDVTFDTGYSWGTHRKQIEDAIKDYLLLLRKSWSDNDELIVRLSQIEARVLAIDGVLDVANTKINGEAANLTVGAFFVPVFGGVDND